MGLALIIGGALGNLIDRVTAGQVLDFIQVSFLPGIFNISDVMVNVGMFTSLAAVVIQPEEQDAEEFEEESFPTADPVIPSEESPTFTDEESEQVEIPESEQRPTDPEGERF